MLRTLLGLEHRLQPVPRLLEQPGHRRLTHHKTRRVQPLHQLAQRLSRPPQRRGRITPGLRRHQRLQRLGHPRLRLLHQRAPRPQRTHPTVRRRPRPDLVHPGLHRGPRGTRHPSHQHDPTPTNRLHLSTQQQPPLPLIQMRPQHSQLLRQSTLSRHTHILTTKPITPKLQPCNFRPGPYRRTRAVPD